MTPVFTAEILDEWLSSLKDRAGAMRIQVRIDRVDDGNFGDVAPVGEGGSEMRNSCWTRYRVYFVRRGLDVVILLAGADKSTQSKDIKKALELASRL
jgi:putative addiction module killer protein